MRAMQRPHHGPSVDATPAMVAVNDDGEAAELSEIEDVDLDASSALVEDTDFDRAIADILMRIENDRADALDLDSDEEDESLMVPDSVPHGPLEATDRLLGELNRLWQGASAA